MTDWTLTMKTALLPLLIAVGLIGQPALAQSHDHSPAAQAQIGEIAITGAFIRATLPRAPVGGAYLTITNGGAEDDRLLGATAPVGRNVELHEMSMQDGVMSMRPMPEGLPIPAGQTVTLEPSGMHLMINGLTEPLQEGDRLDLVLTFEKAGAVAVSFDILALNARFHPDWPVQSSAVGEETEHGTGHDHAAKGHTTPSHESAGFDQHSVEGDEARITGLLKDMFETPDNPLTVAPLLIDGGIAIIGWSQDGRGGRALLRRDAAGLWRVSICAGDGLKGEANMVQMGIEPDAAARLAARQAAAEADLAPDHAARLDLFGEELFFDAEAGHDAHSQH
ncbi:hypothetical protein MASR1M32_22310 [Rhodobacter sp.]